VSASPLIQQLIDALRCLPGVGAKSARRMAYHLLQHDRGGGRRLADALARAMDAVGHCARCRTLSEDETCSLCRSPRRDASQLCVVETPAEVEMLEQAASYQGLYFVLMGHLSPIDGIGPEELGLPLLERRLASGEVRELILATNPTVEGEATAHYLARLAEEQGVTVTRIAYGVPLGGELEYTDAGTLAHAFASRQRL